MFQSVNPTCPMQTSATGVQLTVVWSFFFFLYTVSIQKTRLYHAHSTDFKIHLRELERKISVLVDIVLTANVI